MTKAKEKPTSVGNRADFGADPQVPELATESPEKLDKRADLHHAIGFRRVGSRLVVVYYQLRGDRVIRADDLAEPERIGIAAGRLEGACMDLIDLARKGGQ